MNEENKIEGVEKIQAEEVIDVNHNHEVVQGWFNEAQVCTTPEALQKLSERLLSDVRVSDNTQPYVYAVIALAALKTAFSSSYGSLDTSGRQTVLEIIQGALALD